MAGLTACSIWAALSNPYKSDSPGPADGNDGAPGARPEAGARSGDGRAIDAGFVPFAIAASGDSVYVVDNNANIRVAYDASTQFSDFWTGGGADFVLETNGIAATPSYVVWTVSAAVRYCAADGGVCRQLAATGSPGRIAANDQAVAWLDGTGVRVCPAPPAACVPTTLASSRGAVSVAAGPADIIAWTDGGKTISLVDHLGTESVPTDVPVAALAFDNASGDLYWEGAEALGVIRFDGGAASELMMSSPSKPIELFAANGLVLWSFTNVNGAVFYCRFDSDGGCMPNKLTNTLAPTPTTNRAIVADSRDVLAVISNDQTVFQPTLVVWRLP
jgi:hypothetical protein